MKKILLATFLSIVSVPALGNDQPVDVSHSKSVRVGALLLRKNLPMPAITGSYSFGDDIYAEGTLGSIVVAGTANLGVRYEFLKSYLVTPYLGLQSGLDYTVTESALYYGASFGIRWHQLYLQFSPTYHYRRDFEHSRSYKLKPSAIASIMYEFQSDGLNW